MKTNEIEQLLYRIATNRELLANSSRILREMLVNALGKPEVVERTVNEWEAFINGIKDDEVRVTGIVKAEVVERGESVTGNPLSAIYVKGKTSWDGKGLTGYAVAHPEINAFKKVGNPSCSIKASTEKE